MEMKRNETFQSHGPVIGRKRGQPCRHELGIYEPPQRQSSGPLQRREQLHQRQGDHAKGHLQEPV
jgi:hypothetical protein